MKLHLTLDVDLPTWNDPDLSLNEILRDMADEYPSVASLLADSLDNDPPRTIRIKLERGGAAVERLWER
jgi:hypothetical protein